jgi:hypothetical protein
MNKTTPKRLTLTLPLDRWQWMTTEQKAEMQAKYEVIITDEVAHG